MASSDTKRPIHIAIIGGGIGGAILGIGLSKFANVTFTIYESRGAFGESTYLLCFYTLLSQAKITPGYLRNINL